MRRQPMMKLGPAQHDRKGWLEAEGPTLLKATALLKLTGPPTEEACGATTLTDEVTNPNVEAALVVVAAASD